MNISEKIEAFVSDHKLLVDYEVVSQMKNGKEQEVLEGKIPEYTFTIYVTDLKTNEWIQSQSFDKLEEGLLWGISICEKHIQHII